MPEIEKKIEWCLRKAGKEGERHRGLKKIMPNRERASQHIKKAQKNLDAMNHLIDGGFRDWAMNASFYTRYHCLLAILAMKGYESRNQECTFAVIKQLIMSGE